MKRINSDIHSPDFTEKFLPDFTLSKLEKTFSIAVFERPLRSRHVKKILNSMIINQFFDIVIRVTKRLTGQFEIIDGQHRIEALGLLRDEYGVKKYDLILHIFPEKFARKIYRRINLALPLRMEEHLRALDNGRNPFFVRLRPYFVHYNDGKYPKFEMILNALYYAKNGSPRAVRAMLLDRMFKNITAGDLDMIIVFSRAISKVNPITNPKAHKELYMYATYRNLFRVGYENNFDQVTWENFIKICKSDPVIHEYHNMRTIETVRRIYTYMIKEIGEKMGEDLKRIDRTMGQAKLVLNVNATPFNNYD